MQLRMYAVGFKLGPIVDIVASFPSQDKAEAFAKLVELEPPHGGVYLIDAQILNIQPVEASQSLEGRILARFDYVGEGGRVKAAEDAREAYTRFLAKMPVQWRHVADAKGTAYVVERLG